MGHESRIEPWLPMTTVLLVSFRTDWIRREDTMKTAWKETGNRWAAVFSIRMDGAGSEPNLFKHVGLEAREIPAVGEVFSLDFHLYRTSSPPLKKGEDSYEAWFGFNQSISAGSCFIDRPYCAASPQASHIGLPGPRSCEKRTTHQNLRLISPFSRTEPVRAEKGTGINYPAHLWYLTPSIPLIRLD